MELKNSITLLENSKESFMSKMYQIENGILGLKVKVKYLDNISKQILNILRNTHVDIHDYGTP